jgi:hypothetical protein
MRASEYELAKECNFIGVGFMGCNTVWTCR